MSRELAKVIFDNRNNWEYDLPEGWTYLGTGVSREAFRGPDGNVYKIGQSSVNETEATLSNWLRVNRPMPGVIWPTYEIHDFGSMRNVSETQFFAEDMSIDYGCWDKPTRRNWFINWLARNGLTDSHGGNVWSYRSHMVCIDMGYINEVGAAKECFNESDIAPEIY